MKSQLQLDELARQLMTQKKKDVIVDTSNVNFHANGNNTLHLAEIDEAFTLNDVALNQIATKIGLSKKYLDKMLDGHKSIFQDNINYWFHNTPKQQMVRTIDGTARAFLSDKYKRGEINYFPPRVSKMGGK